MAFLIIIVIIGVFVYDTKRVNNAKSSGNCNFATESEFIDTVVNQKLHIQSVSGKYPIVIIGGKEYYPSSACKAYKGRGRYLQSTGYMMLDYTSKSIPKYKYIIQFHTTVGENIVNSGYTFVE